MQLCHTPRATSAVFDDPNLVSSAGLVPVLALGHGAGLSELARQHLTVPTDKGANAGLEVSSLVAGMSAGADSTDDMALLRHGGMGRVFAGAYAPSTLGSFLRAFTFGHVRQLDAVASRFLTRLSAQAPLIAQTGGTGGTGGRVLVDIDDTIIEVHGYGKQGSGYGYSGVQGLNALLATVSTAESAPVVVAQRLRKGACDSARGAKRLVADALRTLAQFDGANSRRPLAVPTPSSTATPWSQLRSVRAPTSRAPPGWIPRSKPRLPRFPMTCGLRSSTPTRSSMSKPRPGSRAPRSPRSGSLRSPHARQPSR